MSYEQDIWAQLVDELNQTPGPTSNIDGAIKRITKQINKESKMKARKQRTTYDTHLTQVIRVTQADEEGTSRVGHLQIDGQTVSVYGKGSHRPVWKGRLNKLIQVLSEVES